MAHKTHQVIEAIEDRHKEGLEDSTYSLCNMTSRKCDPIMTMVTANGVELKMEVDTGASVSIISEYTYNKLWIHNMPPLQETTLKLRSFNGETLQIHGAITVDVTYNDQTDILPLLVVDGTGPSLMGRDCGSLLMRKTVFVNIYPLFLVFSKTIVKTNPNFPQYLPLSNMVRKTNFLSISVLVYKIVTFMSKKKSSL